MKTHLEVHLLLQKLLIIGRTGRNIISRDDDIKILHGPQLMTNLRALRLRSIIALSVDTGSKDGELAHPILERRGGDDDEVRSRVARRFEVGEEGNNLSGLAES